MSIGPATGPPIYQWDDIIDRFCRTQKLKAVSLINLQQIQPSATVFRPMQVLRVDTRLATGSLILHKVPNLEKKELYIDCTSNFFLAQE